MSGIPDSITDLPADKPSADKEKDLTGQKLGDYQILRRLGRGGMAEVYLAEQLSLHRQVAVKVLRHNLAGDDAYIRRFRHEAQAAAKLVHANIVQIFEVGCLEGTHYIAQEYVAGQNLKQLLTRLGRGLDAPQAVNILRQIAAALHKAAEHNITHRDIKPENIMLSASGEVKVADFGLARVAQAGQMNLTQVGITMGTPLYMSPEQVEGRDVDPRSDIYSLGVTCYHMLAGRTPFDGETALAVAVQHLKTEPKRLEALRPDLPEGLCRIVHKMLAKQPGERYQKAVDLLRELKGLRIAGIDSDWATDLPGFDGGELATDAAGRFAATQQLSRVLQTELRDSPARRSIGGIVAFVVALLLASFAAGATAAWVTRPKPLLSSGRGERTTIKRFESAREQYSYAQMASHDQEEAWQAVATYFPPDKSAENLRYSRLAMKGLAAYYLSTGNLKDALQLYQQLAKVEPNERTFHLVGVAGEAVIYDRLNQNDQVIERLVELRAHTAELPQLGEFLRGEVQKVIDKHPPQGE